MRKVFVLIACCLFVGCASPVQYQSSRPHPSLRGVKAVCLQLDVVSGSESTRYADYADVTERSAARTGDSSTMSGKEHTAIITKDMTFELGLLGIAVTQQKENADAVATFSIGAVRYVGGQWVADQAFLEFRDAKTGEPICAFRADAGPAPISVKTIVKTVARRAGKEM